MTKLLAVSELSAVSHQPAAGSRRAHGPDEAYAVPRSTRRHRAHLLTAESRQLTDRYRPLQGVIGHSAFASATSLGYTVTRWPLCHCSTAIGFDTLMPRSSNLIWP